MNVLSYTLSLNDKMSSTLKRVGVNTNQTTKDVDKLDRSVNNLNNVNLNGFFSTISKIGTFLGVGAALGKTIKMGMEQEMRNTSFEVLFGGADNAKKIIDDISGYAAKSPYGKAGLSEATQMMAGYGIAQEKIISNLKMMGDIAIGDEQKLSSLALVFSQINSVGKLTGENLKQMTEATGFNPLKEMERTTGKSYNRLVTDMSKGLISSQMVINSFKSATSAGGLYYGMIDKINNTAAGQWAAAMENLTERMLKFYNDVLKPIMLPALKKFNKFLEDPIATIGRLTDKITTDFPIITGAILTATTAAVGYKLAMLSWAGLQVVVAGIKSALVAYEMVVFAVKNATSLWTAAQWLLNVALNANLIGVIVAGVLALAAAITFVIMKVDGWGKMWGHTVNGAKLTFQAFVAGIQLYFNTMINGLMIGINKIKEGWYEFKEAVGSGSSSENQKMLAKIHADTEARKNAIIGGAKKVAALSVQAAKEFKEAAGSLTVNKTSFSDIFNDWKSKFGISEAGVPGTNGTTGVGGIAGGGTGSNAGKETANSIATGGSKTTTINIQLGSLISGGFTVNSKDLKEDASKVRDIVLDELTRVLSMAQGQV